ncbi:MAG TPA: hypothetical protein ENI80_05325 [Acidiferrobacteraceae bacterium]|nr:hypothetical protein [Acidiferrobacteraceae bacterium]
MPVRGHPSTHLHERQAPEHTCINAGGSTTQDAKAETGIQKNGGNGQIWTPACAGMTVVLNLQ